MFSKSSFVLMLTKDVRPVSPELLFIRVDGTSQTSHLRSLVPNLFSMKGMQLVEYKANNGSIKEPNLGNKASQSLQVPPSSAPAQA